MDKLKLGLIGCGQFAEGYLRVLIDHPEARLTGVCDLNRQHAEAAAARTGAAVYGEWEALLATPLDGVIITTPNHLHAPITLAAAARGLHVLGEKPMATTLDGAREMVRRCHEASVILMIGLSNRYTAAFRAALERVRSGALGIPLLISDVYHYTLGPALPGRTWHNDPQQMGGGALIQMGIHSIDRVGWFAGARATRIDGQVRRGGGRWSDNIALCQIGYENEVLGHVEVAGVASAPCNTMTIHLTGGEIVAERERVRWYNGEWHEELYVADPLSLEVADFIGAIRERREAFCSGETALPAHEVCFAAYRSSAENRSLVLRNGEYV